jgi:hypothetical protein
MVATGVDLKKKDPNVKNFESSAEINPVIAESTSNSYHHF